MMVLPGSTLYPHALLPLFIFQHKYRRMLEDVLEGHRMFGIASAMHETPEGGIAGAGLVRACVRNRDGTSHLILQGVGRVRYDRWLSDTPYPVASVEPFPSHGTQDASLEAQMKELRAFLGELKANGMRFPPQFEDYLSRIAESDILGDVIAAALVQDPEARQSLLEEAHVPGRLRKLQDFLKKELNADHS